MKRPTILIISDDAEFPRSVTAAWRAERDIPAFTFKDSAGCGQLQHEKFDLAIAGGVHPHALDSVLSSVVSVNSSAIHVAGANESLHPRNRVISLPGSAGWMEILPALANQVLECQRAKAALAEIEAGRTQLEQQATLGRYMLEVRHNLNNALTSVLGNSDLLLMDAESLASNVRAQVETIRNMGMRMNEIMQRFSSLQKEMQLVEQQVWKKKATAAGA